MDVPLCTYAIDIPPILLGDDDADLWSNHTTVMAACCLVSLEDHGGSPLSKNFEVLNRYIDRLKKPSLVCMLLAKSLLS